MRSCKIRIQSAVSIGIFLMTITICATTGAMDKTHYGRMPGQAAWQEGQIDKIRQNHISEEAAWQEETADISHQNRLPGEVVWQEGETGGFQWDDTIYIKDYYDDYFIGQSVSMDFHINSDIRDDLEDYFIPEEYWIEVWESARSMFYDDRSIETPEDELKALFYQHGYQLDFHSVQMDELHLRFIEIRETGGLSLYPICILMQTWDDNYIYLQEITSSIRRTIRGIIAIDNKDRYQMVVHSTGLTRDYEWEEEISFWEYRDTYWALVPMDLGINTRHAHMSGDLYADLDRNTLFPCTYYRDGIAFRTSTQVDSVGNRHTIRLGELEEIEKNRVFRLNGIYDRSDVGSSDRVLRGYIEFTIK